tara:strand:- start:92 stop:385 length:294 start_codon:yes stop_codon:yes gene_type:complete
MPVTYSSDYRSPPTGCGTIETENGELILIQYNGCSPAVYGGIYSNIIYIPYDFSEEYDKAQASLIKILRRYNVTQVHDSELCDGFMTINVFNKLRQL